MYACVYMHACGVKKLMFGFFDFSTSYVFRASSLSSKLSDCFGLASLDLLYLSSVAAVTELSPCPPSIYVGVQVFIITAESSPWSWVLFQIMIADCYTS